jgi:hypothetical protein
LLLSKGLVTREHLDAALRLQVSGDRRLGYLLVKMGFISDEQLQTALADQLRIPIVRIETEFDANMKSVLPRHLCRTYGVLPLSLGAHNTVRLAMINPLDAEAITEIERYTGLVVQPALATHQDIVEAIPRRIPLSAGDLFNARFIRRVWIPVLAAAVLLIGGAVFLAKRETGSGTYGAVSMTGDTIVFRNYDLTVEADAAGRVLLTGRGAHSAAPLRESYDTPGSLKVFIQSQPQTFSQRELEWLRWVVNNEMLTARGRRPAATPR